MKIDELRKNWEQFGREDPLWSILSAPGTKGRKWNEDAFFATGAKHINNLLLEIREDLDFSLDMSKALDFGCGAGRCTQEMARHFNHAVGLDIAQSMIDLAVGSNPGLENLTFVRSEDPELALFESNSFSFIYSNLVLQHMLPEHSHKYLLNLFRILRPGGQLIIIDLLEHQFEKARDLYADVWLGFSENKLYQILKTVGFRKIEVNVVAKESEEPYFQTVLAVGLKN